MDLRARMASGEARDPYLIDIAFDLGVLTLRRKHTSAPAGTAYNDMIFFLCIDVYEPLTLKTCRIISVRTAKTDFLVCRKHGFYHGM